MEDNGLFYLTEKEYPALYDEIYRQTHKLTEKICRECPDILEDGMLRHAQLYTSGVLYAYGVMEPVIYNDVKGMAGSPSSAFCLKRGWKRRCGVSNAWRDHMQAERDIWTRRCSGTGLPRTAACPCTGRTCARQVHFFFNIIPELTVTV